MEFTVHKSSLLFLQTKNNESNYFHEVLLHITNNFTIFALNIKDISHPILLQFK